MCLSVDDCAAISDGFLPFETYGMLNLSYWHGLLVKRMLFLALADMGVAARLYKRFSNPDTPIRSDIHIFISDLTKSQ